MVKVVIVNLKAFLDALKNNCAVFFIFTGTFHAMPPIKRQVKDGLELPSLLYVIITFAVTLGSPFIVVWWMLKKVHYVGYSENVLPIYVRILFCIVTPLLTIADYTLAFFIAWLSLAYTKYAITSFTLIK